MRKQSQAFANSTLFDITAQSIFADRKHFLDLFDCTEINPFDQLCKLYFIYLCMGSNFNFCLFQPTVCE